MVSVVLHGDVAATDRVCDTTRLWVNATSLGGVESSLERRRRWPGESRDVPETLLRMSVGIEDVDDLWNDLAAALDK
jgi:cystathionine gamma-synthase